VLHGAEGLAILLTLPLSGRQGDFGGEAESCWRPVHSRGLLDLPFAIALIKLVKNSL
jgi:hypothetical protein